MHQKFLTEAFKEAQKAFRKGEVPVGAVIVRDGKIISRAHNLTESLNDISAHAEILALKKAGQKTGNWRLNGCTVYATIKPCPMCSSALVMSRVDKTIYGCKSGFHKLNSRNAGNYAKIIQFKDSELENKCGSLMKKFFENIRKRK